MHDYLSNFTSLCTWNGFWLSPCCVVTTRHLSVLDKHRFQQYFLWVSLGQTLPNCFCTDGLVCLLSQPECRADILLKVNVSAFDV